MTVMIILKKNLYKVFVAEVNKLFAKPSKPFMQRNPRVGMTFDWRRNFVGIPNFVENVA